MSRHAAIEIVGVGETIDGEGVQVAAVRRAESVNRATSAAATQSAAAITKMP